MTGPRMRLHERIHVLRTKDVTVVGHREGCARERLAIWLPARFALVAILLHTRMHDEFRERQAAIQLEDALVLGIVLQAQARLDRDGQRRAVAHIAQKHLELVEVTQKAGALALGNHRARRAAEVEIDLAIPQLGQLACGPHELVGVLGEQLRNDVQPLVVGGVDLLECLAAKRITHARRGEKRGVVAVESAKTLSMHATGCVPRDPLHGGERVDHLAILPRCDD